MPSLGSFEDDGAIDRHIFTVDDCAVIDNLHGDSPKNQSRDAFCRKHPTNNIQLPFSTLRGDMAWLHS